MSCCKGEMQRNCSRSNKRARKLALPEFTLLSLSFPTFPVSQFIIQKIIKSVELPKLVDETVAKFGGIDVLVNNAGMGVFGNLEDQTPEILDTVFGVNIKAPIMITQAAIEHLKKSRGAIVNVSSFSSFVRSNSKSQLNHENIVFKIISVKVINFKIFSPTQFPKPLWINSLSSFPATTLPTAFASTPFALLLLQLTFGRLQAFRKK